MPATFLHCMALMESLTSTSVGGLVSMSRAISVGVGQQGHLVDGVWLSTSRKCCTHLAACSCSVVRLLPSLSLTRTDSLVLLSLICLVIFVDNTQITSCNGTLGIARQRFNKRSSVAPGAILRSSLKNILFIYNILL